MTEDQRFEAYAKTLFEKILELSPRKGSYLGLHQYDGIIIPVTTETVESEVQFCKSFLATLREFDRNSLSARNRLDYVIAEWGLESWLFSVDSLKTYKYDPMLYVGLFSSFNDYIGRDYAPFDERLSSVIKIISSIPECLGEAQKLLDRKLPAVLCDFAISFSQGYESFFKGELLNVIREKSGDAQLIERYNSAVESALTAIDNYISFLKDARDENCRSNILGGEMFSEMLKVTEHIDIPVSELKQMALNELKRLHSRIEELEHLHGGEQDICRIEHHHPSPETLISDTKATLNDLVEFIRKNNIVHLPERLNCIVAEMPRYMNFGFAAMDTAGAFEKSDESYYYVNLPEADWDENKKEEWMTQFNYPTLKLISIHEAYPGHYTHFLNANRFSTDLSKLFMSYSYVEGWAHYSEEMMIELGYDKDDYRSEVGMLLEALIRCCRFVAAIGIHCEGMTVTEAKAFFVKNAYMAEATAEQEAKRGEFDPGYLNYTLGKILLKDFKERYFAEFGTSRTLTDFHNAIVGIGAPTFRIAGSYIFGNGKRD